MLPIPAIDTATATPEQLASLNQVRKTHGSVPNLASVMAHSPRQ